MFFFFLSELTIDPGKATELVYGISWLRSPSGTHNVFFLIYSIIRVFYPSIRIV